MFLQFHILELGLDSLGRSQIDRSHDQTDEITMTQMSVV